MNIQDATSLHVTVALSPSLLFQTPSIYLWVKLWFYEKFFEIGISETLVAYIALICHE